MSNSPIAVMPQVVIPDVTISPDACPRWYAVYTSSNHEKSVAAHLHALDLGWYLPTWRTARRWRNRCKVEVELPLFPNYVFAKIGARERGKVLSAPGALAIVGTRREGTPLDDAEIETMRSGLHLRNAEPYPYLSVGEKVRIKSGPLAGLEGVLLRKDKNLRMVITLDLLMQSMSVQVDGDDLEPVSSRRSSLERLR